jgi:hypothetical protein
LRSAIGFLRKMNLRLPLLPPHWGLGEEML